MSEDLLRRILRQLEVTRTIPSTPLLLRQRSVEAAVEYILSNPRFNEAQVAISNLDALRTGIGAVTIGDGVVAEFGVYKGQSLTVIAKAFPDARVHGFDSFVGLPEGWGGTDKGRGAFATGGSPPSIPVENVEFHVGFFDTTVPQFAARDLGPFAFVHLDADLYTSTRIVLEQLQSWFVPGTVVVFDEYFGYHGWQNHEHRAFMEFLEATGYDYEALAIGHMNLAVRLTRPLPGGGPRF